MSKKCKYLPRCTGTAIGVNGVIPICGNCMALLRMKQREAEKKERVAAALAVH